MSVCHRVAAGEDAVVFPPARDYKRIGDGDSIPTSCSTVPTGVVAGPVDDKRLVPVVVHPVGLHARRRAKFSLQSFNLVS